ncbi:hypothetical protein HPB50_000735 [Hyalomma asiaticum]|uniref:Uncharacterized protein n=1 Tax=Hyalomma asiaticum TaxID=266040 RepID=A0ACB7SUI1_HYAAI|nr:hypothetical protein HPB50_000735 [Hyalomma asiaticum]
MEIRWTRRVVRRRGTLWYPKVQPAVRLAAALRPCEPPGLPNDPADRGSPRAPPRPSCLQRAVWLPCRGLLCRRGRFHGRASPLPVRHHPEQDALQHKTREE